MPSVRLLLCTLLFAACTQPAAPVVDPRADQARARIRTQEGLKQMEDQRLDDALWSFENAASLDAAYPDPHRLRAAVLLRQDRREEACAAMTHYVALAKTPAELRDTVLEATCALPPK